MIFFVSGVYCSASNMNFEDLDDAMVQVNFELEEIPDEINLYHFFHALSIHPESKQFITQIKDGSLDNIDLSQSLNNEV